MIRNFWKPAFVLGAVLAANTGLNADDARPLSPASGTTMTLGGKGTAAQAAGEDTELTHGRGFRGYYGWGGGYGYRGYYGGFNSFYRPYYGFNSFSYYRPAFYSSYYYARPVYYSNFYYPTFPVYYSSFGYGSSFYLGIGGGVTSGAPTVTLGGGLAQPPRPMAQPVAPDGTFPYDGGPANPVPLPKADPQAIPPANLSSATDLPISGKPKPATTPYKYKAYGEK